jgi:hypothetical protein
MASQSRKHRGFRTERVVAEYLSTWWPHATVGRGNGKDVLGVPYDCEIKARSTQSLPELLRQIEARTSKSGDLGFGCLRLNGMGETPEKYLAIMRMGDLVQLLIQAGYADLQGDIGTLEPMRCSMCGAWAFTQICRMCQSDPDANL